VTARGRAVVTAVVVALALLGGCSSSAATKGAAITTSTTTPTTTPTTTTTRPIPRYREPVFTDVVVTRDVAYGSAPGADGKQESLKLDLYQPKGDTATKRALAIFVHGGGFGSGDKSFGVSPDLAMTFAKLGYVTASINYRLLAPGGCSGSGAGQPVCQGAAIGGLHDGQAAVRFLRAHAATYGIDPARIGIGGESAGAIVACGIGVWSEAPGDSGTPGVSSAVQVWMSLSGGLPGGQFVTPGDAPGILFSGTSDPIVPYAWSVQTRDALTKANVPVQLVTYDGAGHVPYVEHRSDIIQKTIDVFFTYLGGHQ
jgi:acetyl esterase/lipase